MKKKFFPLLLAFVFIISFSACGNLSDDGNKTTSLSSNTSPKQTIQIAFEALKSGNSKEFNQFIQYNQRQDGVFIYKDNKLFGNNLNGEGKKLIESVFSNLSYNIGEVKKNRDVATVQMQITNRYLSNVGKNMLRYTGTDNPLIEAIKNSDSKMITTNLKITLNKTDGMWKIQLDAALINALCGGLLAK